MRRMRYLLRKNFINIINNGYTVLVVFMHVYIPVLKYL